MATRTRINGAGARGDAETQRLLEDEHRERNWKRFGPYLSERQWGTVREDYSEHGGCWDYFPHDHARSRAYRWGEDGLLGFCDRQGRLCFALCLWNEQDPILKDLLIRVTVANRGPAPAALHLLPTLWFRNIWSWGRQGEGYGSVPRLALEGDSVVAQHEGLGQYRLHAEGAPQWLFTENETNCERLFGGPSRTPY